MRSIKPASRKRLASNGAAGGDAIDHLEAGVAGCCKIGVADRKAVHRRIVEWRQVDRREDILGNDTAVRGGERHGFDLRHRRHALRDHPLHLGHREQRTAKGKAIVGELGHQAAP
jgi:hypothetical protein